MLDLLMNQDDDLYISGNGDIALTHSIAQTIKIRLRWFWGEWLFDPDKGVPYYTEVLIKNYNRLHIDQLIREQILSVDGVEEVESLTLQVDNETREAHILFTAKTAEGSIRDEVYLNAA